jgi:hypothetical protein
VPFGLTCPQTSLVSFRMLGPNGTTHASRHANCLLALLGKLSLTVCLISIGREGIVGFVNETHLFIGFEPKLLEPLRCQANGKRPSPNKIKQQTQFLINETLSAWLTLRSQMSSGGIRSNRESKKTLRSSTEANSHWPNVTAESENTIHLVSKRFVFCRLERTRVSEHAFRNTCF